MTCSWKKGIVAFQRVNRCLCLFPSLLLMEYATTTDPTVPQISISGNTIQKDEKRKGQQHAEPVSGIKSEYSSKTLPSDLSARVSLFHPASTSLGDRNAVPPEYERHCRHYGGSTSVYDAHVERKVFPPSLPLLSGCAGETNVYEVRACTPS